VTCPCANSLLIQRRLEVDGDSLGRLHDDCEGDALEAGDEVEGAFFGDWVEALRGLGADG